jgi:hypothetical protein
LGLWRLREEEKWEKGYGEKKLCEKKIVDETLGWKIFKKVE